MEVSATKHVCVFPQLRLCSGICSASQVPWPVLLAKSSPPRRTLTVSSWAELPSSQSLLTSSTPRHKNWRLARSESTFRAFGFSPSRSALSFLPFFVQSTCAMMSFPCSPLFFVALGIFRKGQVDTFAVIHWNETTCVLTTTPSAQWSAVSLRLYLKSLQRLCEQCQSDVFGFFFFLITLLSLCDIQWLVTPCRRAWPTLSLSICVSGKCPCHVDQFGLKVKGWERCNKML